MSRNLYRQYLVLCQKWAIDPTKEGRDLGEHLRQRVAQEFRHGDTTEISNIVECEQKLQSLQRLVANYYKNQHSVGNRSTASTLTPEECKELLSTKTLEEIKEKQLPFWRRMSFWKS